MSNNYLTSIDLDFEEFEEVSYNINPNEIRKIMREAVQYKKFKQFSRDKEKVKECLKR